MPERALKAFNFDPAGLKHQIELRAPDFDAISPWQGATSTQLVAQVWAGVLNVSAQEKLDAEQAANSRSIELIMRHRTDLGTVTMITFDGQSFDLLSMSDPDFSKRWLIIQARSTLGHA
ncbi:phage head closure protein [Cohaesibacter celericrescens]|jgi:SPP1 family predicted phage head-tail adaptor|uniref:Head-tail adaptor protein n=1 Tax=Cohaesibacter celericrescens TaxID=2067669 RepID=A0A2N5XR80_9HYPH|nr:phage head closure protein [Cohaesibacter celericrescens]PLW76960.1 hypothetical protein C0081_13015 [Cohaesibacter celericrescens]